MMAWRSQFEFRNSSQQKLKKEDKEMEDKYVKAAQEILDCMGGQENIASAAHCATRLRLVLKDESLIDKDALESIELIKGNFNNGGQFQIILGTGIVNKVYAEFIKIANITEMTKEEYTKAAIAFCETIRKAGYTPMIYGNLKTFMIMLDMEQIEAYDKWFAYYDTTVYFPYDFTIWQYSSNGSVKGIGGNVDMNVCMKDYSHKN